MSTDRPAFAYRPDIDGLRTVAVMLVLVFHFRLLPFGHAGFIGVDVFFVISGYLITSIVVRQLDTGRFSLASFYRARIRRLMAALAVVLAAVLAYGWFRLTPIEFAELGRQVAAAQFYVSNFYYWRNFNYFGVAADSVFLLHTWSLAVEEQFYLLFPFVMMALHRWARRWLWAALAVAALVSFALGISQMQSRPMAAFYLLPTRAWELLAGALLARWKGRVGSASADGLGALATVLLVYAVVSYHPAIPVPGWFALLPVAAALLLIVAGAATASWTSRLLASRPMVYVGHLSYVLYLVHWPVHVIAMRELGQDAYTLGWRLAMFLLSIALSALVCHAIEDRVRFKRWLGSDGSLVTGYALVLAVSAVLCAFVVFSRGVPARLPPDAAQAAEYADDRVRGTEPCESAASLGQDLPACRIGQPGVTPRWLLLGDSHAYALRNAVDAWLQRRGEAGWIVYHHACPPLQGIYMATDGQGKCHAFNEAVYDWLRRTPAIDRVLMASPWIYVHEHAFIPGPGRPASYDESAQLFQQAFDRSIARLQQDGKTIVLWGPVPGANGPVPRELALARWKGHADGERRLMIPIDEHRKVFVDFYEALARHRKDIAAVVLPAQALCAQGSCLVTHEGIPLYYDNAHITASTAKFWADVIDRAVGSAVPVQAAGLPSPRAASIPGAGS